METPISASGHDPMLSDEFLSVLQLCLLSNCEQAVVPLVQLLVCIQRAESQWV